MWAVLIGTTHIILIIIMYIISYNDNHDSHYDYKIFYCNKIYYIV